MIEILTILLCVITLILLKYFLNIKIKDIKKLNNRENAFLEEISNKFPKSEEICRDILKSLNNENVEIKIEPEYNSCLYTIFNNTITLGKFKQEYMKLQTIAHECIHSVQNKNTLWANFIFTNIYLVYFFIIALLGILNKINYSEIHILILVFISFIQYILRNYLETDAMTKAKYVAKEYINKSRILNKIEEEKLLVEYEEVNKIGIPFMNYYILASNIIKIIIFCIIVLI